MPDCLARETDGQGRTLGDARGQRERLALERLRRDDPRADAVLQRLVGVQDAAAEDDLECQRAAGDARQPLRAAGAGDQPETRLGQPEARILRGQHDVARERELAAAAEAPAVHRRDDR